MNNQDPQGPLDEASLPDGDLEFIGVEERTVFSSPGYVNRAVNTRFRTRRAASRDGITILPWALGNGLTPFTDVYGGFVFADPNGINEYIVVAANGHVYYTRPNTPAKVVPLPAGVTLTRATFKKFIQVNACIILLRGLSNDGTKLKPLQLTPHADGSPDFVTGFQVIQQENQFAATLQSATNRVLLPQHNLLLGDPFTLAATPGVTLPTALVAGKAYYVKDIPNADEFTFSATPGGAQVTWNLSDTDALTYAVTTTILDGAYPIPEAVEGIAAQNRLFLIDGKDTTAVSDIGDFTRYVPTQNDFRINAGDAYTLKFLYLFNESTLLFFKNGNVSKAVGVTGDLNNVVGPLNVTQAYGIAAPSVADIGTDVFWLNSELRITSLQLTELNKEQGSNQALSDPLLRTFGRINPQAAPRARLAVFDGYLHVALPLDDAQLVADSSTDLVAVQNAGGTVYPVTLTVTPGQKYQWRQNSGYSGTSLQNGSETVYGDTDFTAQGATVTLQGPAGDVVTDTVLAIVADQCNTGVAVYDYLNGAWAGTDETPGVTHVVDWLKFTYNGRQVLAFVGADGLLHLYNDGYEDEKILPVANPYVDIFVNNAGALVNGQTLNISGSAIMVVTVVADTSSALNLGHVPGGGQNWRWGVGAGGSPSDNLWNDVSNQGGFNPGATSYYWQLYGSVLPPEQIADGVRLYGSAGAAPTVNINGTVVKNGNYLWAFVDTHEGNEIQPVPIASEVVTRAYPCKSFQSYAKALTTGVRGNFKRYTCAQVHIAGWNPKYSITTLTQGQGDTTPYIVDEQRNYLNYFSPIDAAAWDPDNIGDNYHAPNREDYSYPETGRGIFLKSGVNFDQLQEYADTVPISERGLYVQLDITNATGRLELVGVEMEAQMGEQNSGVSVKN